MKLTEKEKSALRAHFAKWCEREGLNKHTASSVEKYYREVIPRA